MHFIIRKLNIYCYFFGQIQKLIFTTAWYFPLVYIIWKYSVPNLTFDNNVVYSPGVLLFYFAQSIFDETLFYEISVTSSDLWCMNLLDKELPGLVVGGKQLAIEHLNNFFSTGRYIPVSLSMFVVSSFLFPRFGHVLPYFCFIQ